MELGPVCAEKQTKKEAAATTIFLHKKPGLEFMMVKRLVQRFNYNFLIEV